MKKTISLIVMLLAVMIAVQSVSAQSIVRKRDRHIDLDSVEHVLVGNDTVALMLPERNLGRFDRGLFNYIFIPRGKWSFGLTASYGELQTEDIQVLSILKDFDFKGKMYAIKPYFSYFIRSNQAVGIRLNYTRGFADLSRLAVDFDEDLNFAIRDVSYYQQGLSTAVFYRRYVGLDKGGRFGIFNDVDLEFGSGSSRFKRIFNGEPRDTRTITTHGALNFSPGVCVFIQDYVSFNISFGVFGVKWSKERQTTDGVDEGSRITSGANFKFNLFNINFGLMVVI